ncbi:MULTISPECIES: hypothetical protein [unclassified Variovorax]|jgi:hypothetical protein|uniref:hypothetical protein n=1 Tax=unclassified Variovorax TaxID=663243 RepID=UPI000F7E3EF9|nr:MULTISPECIES: hypothetical protein [unclassified Variovorax]RSZ38273.1 hypothetical protein EJO70_19245 [Variovorax sp. 553]RSZ39275.1 hypothetical protein EJO71_20005 [Variovorax sp. 679]
MNVEPLAARYVIETTPGGGLRAVVPARKHWLFLLFMCVWLTGWCFGEFTAANQLLHPRRHGTDERWFLTLWLAGWTVGGAWAFFCVLWQLFGRELISVEEGSLVHRVEIWGLGRTRAYAIHAISRLRVVEFSFDFFRNQRAAMPPLFGAGMGPIAFDYGQRSFRIAPSLDEAEARSLITILAERLPRAVREL